MLGLYLLGRLFARVFALMLLMFVCVAVLVWLALCAIGSALMDPATWSSKYRAEHPRRPRPRVPPAPRNPRMYHSNRR